MHYQRHIFLCTNQKAPEKPCCANKGGESFFDYMKAKLIERSLHGPGKIRISKSGCLGRCHLGPCVVIYPEGTWYTYATTDDLDEIIENHLLSGRLIERLLLPDQSVF